MNIENNIKPSDRILVVAPHPDDESIGCGGLMLKYGAQCDVLILTDGRKGYDSSVQTDEEGLVKQRALELRNATNLAGITSIYMLGIPDGKLLEQADKVYSFDIKPYDSIFVPNHLERHKDHAPILKIFERMNRNQKAKARIYEYEVWSPIASPTDVLNLEGLMEQKLEMVHQYQSQIRFLDYEGMTEALNRYRGAGQKIQYAEVYAYVPQLSVAKRVFYKLPTPVRKALGSIRRKLR